MTYENFLFKNLEKRAERRVLEHTSDPQDTVTVDVPLLIRLLELAREEIKSDIELHQVVERILAIKNRGTLSMDDYSDIVKEKLPIEQPTPLPQVSALSELRKLAGLR